jgi:Peptidase family M1 domain
MMKRIAVFLITILVILTNSTFAEYSHNRVQAIYDSLWSLQADLKAHFTLEDFSFSVDAGDFYFETGEGYLLNSVDGKSLGLFFKGKGVFSLEAPTPVEKFSINKFTKNEKFEHEFKTVLLFFSPDLYEKHFANLAFSAGEQKSKSKSDIKYYYDRLDEFGIDIGAALLPTIYNSKTSPYTMALMKSKSKRYYFIYDPRETETVTLYRQEHIQGYNLLQSIAKFYPQEHYDAGLEMYSRDHVNQAMPLHYDINSFIDKNTDIITSSRLIIQSNQDSLIALTFSHHYKIDMDSVKAPDNSHLVIDDYDDDEISSTSVFLRSPLMSGELDTINFYYHSKDIIKKDTDGDFYLLAPNGWFPRLGYRNTSTFNLKYQSPANLTFLSTGQKVKDTVIDDWRYTEFTIGEPVRMVGFNYGWFDSLTMVEPNLPKVEVYRSNAGHVKRLFGGNMLEVTASDVMATLQFCINMFGPYPYGQLLATEIPMAHGQSFPGFLHLAWASFEGSAKGKAFETDAFRAHEVSHQWWGGIVDWKSYHDQWLSEGFAEYTSAWFMQEKDGNNKRFLRMLGDWKDLITQKGGGTGLAWSEGSDAGPIWLGYRLSSTKSSDYVNLVYSKGAFVLHMLRMILHDYKAHSDETFILMMRDFVRLYRGRSASTADFIKHTELHFKMDMDWFFNTWIFGTEIPTIKPKYEVLEQEGGYIVKANFEIKDVPDDFKMIVPLVVEFENDAHAVLKFWIKAPTSEYQSKVLPYKPKKFIFNPYNAVLCHEK